MKDTSDKVEYTDIGQAVDQVAVSEGNEREAVDVGVRTNAETGITELQSLCMNCQEKGVTRLMLTRIPFFREIIVMSFDCDYCGFHNNEVQFGGEIQEKGCKHVLKVTEREDLNRQVIKADTATITIPELEFEIPAKTQAGLVNTIEGFLTKSASDLRELQEERRKVDPALAQKIDDIIGELTLFAAGLKLPFTVILDDPAGNSFVENPFAPKPDPNLQVTKYFRSEAQDLAVGLQPDQSQGETHEISTAPKQLPSRNQGLDKYVQDAQKDDGEEKSFAHREVVRFPQPCPNCQRPGEMLMCMTEIPHFKEVIIMAYDCQECGFKSNEVKGGGAIPPYGETITFKVTGNNSDDMSRDVLKSDSAGLEIPELDLEMASGSLGGLYTTVEGLIEKIIESIEEGNPFAHGDSAQDDNRRKLAQFLDSMKALKSGNVPFTLIIRDPLANSFIYNPFAPNDDPNLWVVKYTRSYEEDEDLGLNDMDTSAYDSNEKLPEVSDKEQFAQQRGGKPWLEKDQYHPLPQAILQVDKEGKKIQ